MAERMLKIFERVVESDEPLSEVLTS
jgi:hypothetical protein